MSTHTHLHTYTHTHTLARGHLLRTCLGLIAHCVLCPWLWLVGECLSSTGGLTSVCVCVCVCVCTAQVSQRSVSEWVTMHFNGLKGMHEKVLRMSRMRNVSSLAAWP